RLIIGLQQLLAETEAQTIVKQLQEDMLDFIKIRPLLIDLLCFIENNVPEKEISEAAEVLGNRLKNLRVFE
ncbi:hypothetical protein, partial [Candidatus Venteria ishoeyi]